MRRAVSNLTRPFRHPPPPAPDRHRPAVLIWAAGVALAAGPWVTGAAAQQSTEGTPGEALLARADSAYRAAGTVRALFSQHVENRLLARDRSGRGVWHLAPGSRVRMEYHDPEGDILVADGRCLWIWEPSLQPGQIQVSPVGEAGGGRAPDMIRAMLDEAQRGYDITNAGMDEPGGPGGTGAARGQGEGPWPTDRQSLRRLVLEPHGPGRYRRIELWISEPDYLVRRIRVEEESELVRIVALSHMETGVAMPDSLFRFDPPAGVSVFSMGEPCG